MSVRWLSCGVVIDPAGRRNCSDVVSRPAFLAAALVRAGAEIVVVGGTARWLRRGTGWPRDLDVVIAPAGVGGLVHALHGLGIASSTRAMLDCQTICLATGWGPLDVFVDVLPGSDPVPFDGVAVPVKVAA